MQSSTPNSYTSQLMKALTQSAAGVAHFPMTPLTPLHGWVSSEVVREDETPCTCILCAMHHTLACAM